MSGQMLLLSANPKRRKSAKRRSPAQRAATARMLAANKSNPRRASKKRRSRARSRARSASVATVSRRTRRTRSARSSGGGGARRFSMNAAVGLLKNGAIGGAGAIGLDVVMGYGGAVLPASVTSRVNADGTTNWLYYGVKGALAVAVGTFGGKLVKPALAEKLAEGALTVMSYELARGMMPAGVTLGYVNPAKLLRGTGKIVSMNGARGVGNIVALPDNRNSEYGSAQPAFARSGMGSFRGR